MSTLITGGAGFIGGHLAAALLARGEPVIVLDNFNDYYDPAIKRENAARLREDRNCRLIEGDIRDIALVDSLFAGAGITRVAHMAAMAGVRASVQQPRLYFDVNLTGTLNLLEAAQRAKVQGFVLASTSSVYGNTEALPFVETDTADRPLAAYPASKRAAELLAYAYHNLAGMPITCLRFFNVYGPAGRPDMMPWRLLDAARTGTEIKLFNGGDIHRDWTYIDDTIAGVLAALDTPLGYEIINLGVGAPISLNEFIKVIEALTGKCINTVDAPRPPSDPPITYCDNGKARQLLGFAPAVPVREGLRRTWEWYAAFHGL